MPKCSHCLVEGHNKTKCPSKDLPPTPPPEKEPPANRWTPEKEQILINRWKADPLHYNMDEISMEIGMSKSGCENRLNELIPVEEQVRLNSEKLSINDIETYITDLKVVCSTCSGTFYNSLKEWRGILECEYCHRLHREEIDQTWIEIDRYLIEKNMDKCGFCSRVRNSTIGGFHFDHINMFEKNDNICSMVSRGAKLEEIIGEINKCQLICISCHNIITSIERNLGYHRLKAYITRKQNNGADIESLKTQYINSMLSVYQKMREMFYPNVFSLV